LKKTFWYDFKINKNYSWFLVCFIPLAFFVLGFKNFISIIVLTGALMAAIGGTLIVLIHKKTKTLGTCRPAYNINVHDFFRYTIIGFFILAFIYTIVSLFF
jgi:hypothetical protein